MSVFRISLTVVLALVSTGWAITLVPQLMSATTTHEAWQVLRIPAWTGLAVVAALAFLPEAFMGKKKDKEERKSVVNNLGKDVVRGYGLEGEDDEDVDEEDGFVCCQERGDNHTSSNEKGDATEGCGCSDNTNSNTCCNNGDNEKEKTEEDGCCKSRGGSNSNGGKCCKDTKLTNLSNSKEFVNALKSLSFSRVETTSETPWRAEEGVRVFYGSVTGTSEAFAKKAANAVEQSVGVEVEIQSLDGLDVDKLCELNENGGDKRPCLFLVSTYEGGVPPTNAKWFYNSVMDAANDWRVKSTHLSFLGYSVFGLGNSLYKDNFNKVSRDLEVSLAAIGGQCLSPVLYGDENVEQSANGSLEADFNVWLQHVVDNLKENVKGKTSFVFLPEGQTKQLYDDEDEENTEQPSIGCGSGSGDLVDLEDMGDVLVTGTNASANDEKSTEKREMVTPNLRKALTKQGYRLIGSHSGVKLCRWTKSMIRGRGGCYKHTFYGIESHRCMETTPSLACANKCVFCWRHHTNPVGTHWKWKMDEPIDIVNGAMKNHYSLVKQFQGAPHVKQERLHEAMCIRHCALSLVGEPIMYPKINDFLDLLHSRGISSFLVTNAQFPDEMEQLHVCTQLYLSIDASSQDALKKIDRPIFSDFWERFNSCLDLLATRPERTVFRLTVVKAWNDDEIDGYRNLVRRGQPDFIEVKGVTYCGSSKASTLTMGNVPFHEEVVGFVERMVEPLDDYVLLCEHEHSNSVLAVHKKFCVNGRWHTWIDYDKFLELEKGNKPFTALDYAAPTPEWAMVGHEARGFDPIETRHRRKQQKDQQ
eukprot:m.143863 g.143863  ORF g.143863 m.143863 type:complete len:813 (-) comp13217_c0_seq4:270-2708(-)